MDKNKIKEIFEKMRAEEPQYIIKTLNDKPIEAGTYTISIEDIRSIVPMTLKFYGVEWEKEGLESALKDANGDIAKISYYDIDLTNKNKHKI